MKTSTNQKRKRPQYSNHSNTHDIAKLQTASSRNVEGVTKKNLNVSDEALNSSGQNLEKFVNISKEKIVQSINGINEVKDFIEDNINTTVKISTKSLEVSSDAFNESVKLSRTFIDGSINAFNSVLKAKSPNEALELQSNYVKSLVEEFITHSSKSVEALPKLTNEVFQPAQDQISASFQKFFKGFA